MSVPDPPSPRGPDPRRGGPPPGGPSPPQRGSRWPIAIAYVLAGLMLVWLWQSPLQSLSTRTISYHAFKQYLAAGKVVSCKIGQSEIRGVIHSVPPAPDSGAAAGTSKANATKANAAKGDTAQANAPKAAASEPSAPKAGTSEPGPPKAKSPSPGASGAPSPTTPTDWSFQTVRVDDPDLVSELQAKGVDYSGSEPSILPEILGWLAPLGLLALVWIFLMRRMSNPGQAMLGFGRSRAKLVAEGVSVTFDDVAGCDEAKTELREIVEFLRKPDRFSAIGAVIPKGVLLVGPPGTGKTLLARAVAGEAKVPFFSLSGSDFVEMFVGVGAARVRDLFEQAKSRAPCIVFVDELDAVGRARGISMGNVNDEREHTLNQLLVEMDGFEPNSGVVLLAATNRPDVLDTALLRPGRFDRQVVLDAPDVVGREQILRIHVRGKHLASNIDFAAVARSTPGFSGADLANVVNEAALLAARRSATEITQKDFEAAVEKVVAGPERKSRRLDEKEKRRVAFHEVGHALVAIHSEQADPVHKISIVPRGRAALGYTLQYPLGERYLMSRGALMDRIKGLLGGRAAEELVFGDVSTGPENDLEHATAVARRLVCQFGMGKAVGLMHCARESGMLRAPGRESILERDCSEETAARADEEIRELLDGAYTEAKRILVEHRSELDRVAEALLEKETLDEAAIRSLLDGDGARGARPSGAGSAAPRAGTA